MKEITILPLSEHGEIHTAYQIDDTHAIYSNGHSISIFEIKPIGQPDHYKPAQMYNYVTVAYGEASLEELTEIVENLKSMTAYTLVTQYFDVKQSDFNIFKSISQ